MTVMLQLHAELFCVALQYFSLLFVFRMLSKAWYLEGTPVTRRLEF